MRGSWGRSQSRERTPGGGICAHYRAGKCQFGDQCRYSHNGPQDRKTYSSLGSNLPGTGGGNGPPRDQDERSNQDERTVTRRSSQREGGSIYNGSNAGSQSYQAVQEGGRSDSSVQWTKRSSGESIFGPIWERGTDTRDVVAALSSPKRGSGALGIGSLRDLPKDAWEEVAKPTAGYNYRVEVGVDDARFTALLDTGASTNAVPEELIIALINHSIAKGLRPGQDKWPVALERWNGTETVSGVARGQDLEIIGAAVVPIDFRGMDGRMETRLMRFKIFAKGCSGWMGFIIGGPSLEPIPLGLGLRTNPGGHHLAELGLTLRRKEEQEVSDRMDHFFTVSEGSAVGPLEADLWADDSDCSEDYQCDDLTGWMNGSVQLPVPRANMSPVLCMADDVVLAPGAGAWIPAALQKPLVGRLEIMPNSSSPVCCANGQWDETEGMLLVMNRGVDTLTLDAGDIVAAAWEAPLLEASGDVLNHVIQDDGLIERIFEVELPPEEYYDLLAKDMRQRHPGANPFVLQHLESLEALMDVAEVTGFSFGASKAVVLEVRIKLLGEYLDRYGRSSTEEHTRAITQWPPILEIGQLRQFLGTVNWVRSHLPAQFSQALKPVSPFLGKAEWPLNAAALAGIEAMKKMTAASIRLDVLDEVGMLSGLRPQEQIADSSIMGWGGTIYQMSEDRKVMNVLGHHSGGLTKSQGAWPVLTLELNAQLKVRIAGRAVSGKNPCLCWSDHSNVVRLQTAVDLDPRHLRWVSNIMSDGSVLMNLSGRSAKLGDGLSRNPITDQLREQARSIQGFSVAEFLADCSTGGMEAQTLPSHCLPDPDTASASVRAMFMAIGERMDVKTLLLEDYGTSIRRSLQQAQLWRDLASAYPWVNFRFEISETSFTDDLGEGFWFDPEPQRAGNPVVRTKKLRRDLLTGLTRAVREVARVKPQIVLGIGQGAVIALLLSKPRLCETSLRTKVVQVDEMKTTGMSEAWQGVQAVLAVVPQIFKARSNLKMLTDALPELVEPTGERKERSIDCFSLGWKYAHEEFEKLLNGVLGVTCVKGAEQVLLDTLLQRRPLQLNHHYACPCGRPTMLLPMCSQCTALKMADEAGDKLVEEPPSDEEIVVAFSRKVGPVLHLRRGAVEKLLNGRSSRPHDKSGWVQEEDVWWNIDRIRPGRHPFPTIPKGTLFRLMFAWGLDGLAIVQKCVDPVHETVQQLDVQALRRRPQSWSWPANCGC